MVSDRVARAVDDTEELPEIELQYIEVKDVSESTDDFAASGEEVKALRGVSANVRRRVTNEIRKYNRSADRAVSSKQVDENTLLTGYDIFGVVEPPHNLDALVRIYSMSAPHYAAVNAKVANIVGLGYKLVETRKTMRALEKLENDQAEHDRVRQNLDELRDQVTDEIEGFNEEDSFSETLQRVWRDYEVTGNGYLEIGRKRDGTIGYLGHIQAQTVRVRRLRDGFVQINGGNAAFFRNFGDDAPNPLGDDSNPNELIHIKRYNPSSAYYGVPDIVAAEQAIAGNEFAARFNLDYFENKAVPRHVITLKGANLTAASQRKLLEFFETGFKGQNHRSLFLPLPADDGVNKVEFKIDAVEQGEQDSSFNAYHNANRDEILMVHRVPIGKVSAAAGASLATSRDADKTFKEQVCQPEQALLESKVNRVVKELTDAYELQFNEMSLTDTNTQSQIDERMVKTGIWLPNEPRLRDGMTAIDGGNERVDLNAANKLKQQAAEATTNRQRDAARSANQTDGAGEGRNPKGDGRTQS